MVDEIEESGVVDEDKAELLHGTIDYASTEAYEIMTPRVDVYAIDVNDDLDEVLKDERTYIYSRIPVYKNDKDHIVGILYVRDFFPALVKNSRLAWKKLIRPVKFVSSQMKIDDLIVELQKSKMMLAIVSGEYGDVLGLVSMEDALEEIVGEINDEHDVLGQNDLLFEQQDDGSYLVDADMYVEDLFERLNIGDVPEDVPSKLSGWLFAKCESIPEVGFSMKYIACYTMHNEESESYEDSAKAIEMTIAEVDGRRIHLIKVVVRDATDEEIELHQSIDED